MIKILFLDLDGTVRRPKSEAEFINSPHEQELIPGVAEAILKYPKWVKICDRCNYCAVC